jgi:UDP-N-acetylglucosamine 2-epimerase (non-hydrolysing)
MAPVIVAARDVGLPCHVVLTGQHLATVDELLADFGLEANERLWQRSEIKRIFKGLGWSGIVLWRLWRLLRRQSHRDKTIVLVHGDTMSTLIGAFAGRLARCRVAHVEAGLRSGSLLDPFPEEIIRRIVTWLAEIAYCPGEEATSVVRRTGRYCVNTVENTVMDSIRMVLDKGDKTSSELPDSSYVIVSAHRMETVLRHRRLSALVDLVLAITRLYPVRFVLHPVTKDRLERSGLIARLQESDRVELTPRMGYAAFIRLASDSRAILTDGGGNQEEMAYLGIPTLLLRNRSEREQGLDGNAKLIGLDSARAIRELESTDQQRKIKTLPIGSPSERIANHMLRQRDSAEGRL